MSFETTVDFGLTNEGKLVINEPYAGLVLLGIKKRRIRSYSNVSAMLEELAAVLPIPIVVTDTDSVYYWTGIVYMAKNIAKQVTVEQIIEAERKLLDGKINFARTSYRAAMKSNNDYCKKFDELTM